MSPTRKDSLASWTTNHSTLETGEGNSYDRTPLPPRPSQQRDIYGASSPHRPLFLAARTLCICLGIVLIALSIIAQRGIGRDKWMAPILSPAIQSCCTSGIDVYFILRRNRRSPALQRLLYDGAIGIGFAIAGGFLVSFTLGDMQRTRAGSSAATAAVAVRILFCMFSEM